MRATFPHWGLPCRSLLRAWTHCLLEDWRRKYKLPSLKPPRARGTSWRPFFSLLFEQRVAARMRGQVGKTGHKLDSGSGCRGAGGRAGPQGCLPEFLNCLGRPEIPLPEIPEPQALSSCSLQLHAVPWLGVDVRVLPRRFQLFPLLPFLLVEQAGRPLPQTQPSHLARERGALGSRIVLQSRSYSGVKVKAVFLEPAKFPKRHTVLGTRRSTSVFTL